jgi:plasmid stabilization system protein ParE
MATLVSITSRAEVDLADLYGKINAEYSDAALTWYRGLKEAILSLEEHPNSCRLTRKMDKVRQLLYGHEPHIYRLIYRVLEEQKRVEVLHIRHGAGGNARSLILHRPGSSAGIGGISTPVGVPFVLCLQQGFSRSKDQIHTRKKVTRKTATQPRCRWSRCAANA